MELKEIKDTIFELTHIKDEEGNDVPHFCFATDISTDTEETEEEIATIAAKDGYSIYKVFPGETMVGGLVILADGASIDLVKDMYDNFYGEAPEIAKMELNDDEKLVEVDSLEEKIVKKGSKWQVQSEKGKNLGTYDTKREAEKRLKDVEMFKHMNEDVNFDLSSDDFEEWCFDNMIRDIDSRNCSSYYIFPDGEVFGTPSTHDDMISEFFEDNNCDEDIYKYLQYLVNNQGVIRCTGEDYEHYIQLPSKGITQQQYKTLTEWLDYYSTINEKVQIMIKGTNFNHKTYFYKENTVDEIIKKIKRLYTTGVLVDSLKEDLQETDNEGNTLSKEQIEFFKNSKVRDEQGRLLVCYHGTNKDFNTFDKSLLGTGEGTVWGKGFYFFKGKDSEVSASEYGSKVKKVYINITNPIKEESEMFAKLLKFNYPEADTNDFEKFREKYWNDYNDEYILPLYVQRKLKVKVDDLEDLFLQMVKNAGYDGRIVDNEVICYESNQIKSIDNKNPTSSNNINENNIIFESLKEDVEKEIQVRDNPNIEEDAEECPLPLEIIPNNMGINLSNVEKVEWEETDDGQLKELEIKFIPGDDLDEDVKVEDDIFTEFDKFGDIKAFKKKYEDVARELGASIEFKTLVGPYRLDSFWYGSQYIATIHCGEYTIDIYGSDDEPAIIFEDGTELVGLDELEHYGIFNDATFPSDNGDAIFPCIEFSIKNDNDGVWYNSYSDLDYDSAWDLETALDIDFYVNSVIPSFGERYLDESKKKTVKARDPNAQAMWGRTRHKVEMPKKGKGSFKRHSKHRLGEEVDLEEAKKKKDNELKARARKHKKSDKKGAMGWFVHPNVETNIQAFNHAMGSADAPSTITAPAGLGEDIAEEPIKESDLIDFNYKLITDYRTQGYIRDSNGYPIKDYYYNKVPETCYVVEKDNYLQDTLLRKRKNRRVLNGVKDFFNAHPKSKYCVISAWDISRGDGATRPINTYRVLAANNISDYFVLRNKKFPKDSVIYSSTEKNTAIKEYYSKERNIGWELVQIKEGKETKLYPNPEEDMLEAVEKHDTLNPKLWDEDNNLKPEVREKILEIVKEFTDTLEEDEIKFKIKDIVLVGSNCSYNYNEMSDLDIHIRMDTKSLECPDNLYPLLYSAYRSLFNKKFDIDFYGIPVELYIETDDTEQMSEEPIDN